MTEKNVKQNFIQSVTVNLFDNIFSQKINFTNGLNIIAGGNGTGKTELLKYINQHREDTCVNFENSNGSKELAVFSPKRNAEKQAIEAAYQTARQDPNIKNSTLQAIRNHKMNDAQYQTLKPISGYLAAKATSLNNTGTITLVDAFKQVEEENQLILEKVFDYKIEFKWDTSTEKPELKIQKLGFNLKEAQLSEGENALISLFFAIFDAKDKIDVFLIDEPEVHLNWQLEEKLFAALDWFCATYNKQIILVTHSRACFIDPYINKTQFLVWSDNKILVENKPDERIRQALAGDLVKIVGGVTIEDKIVFVEDSAQETVLKEIKTLLNSSLKILKQDGRSKVEQLSKAFKKLNINGNSYFLIDNDNDEISGARLSQDYCNLIQLKKYCIENYFLNHEVLGEIDKRNDKTKTVQEVINECIKQVNQQKLKPYVKIIELNKTIENEVLDTADASAFIAKMAKELSFKDKHTFFKEYIVKLQEKDLLNSTFPEFFTVLFK